LVVLDEGVNLALARVELAGRPQQPLHRQRSLPWFRDNLENLQGIGGENAPWRIV
jgi:hypothetical protein